VYVFFFSREVIGWAQTICQNCLSLNQLDAVELSWLWVCPVALLSLFFCPLHQCLLDLPSSIMVTVCQANLTSRSCQASAGVSVKVTTREDGSLLLLFLKKLKSRHPQPLLSSAVSEKIWDQLKGWRPWSLEISFQLSGHVRTPAGHNEGLLTSAEGWKRREPHAYSFTLRDTFLPYIVCAQPSWASEVHI